MIHTSRCHIKNTNNLWKRTKLSGTNMNDHQQPTNEPHRTKNDTNDQYNTTKNLPLNLSTTAKLTYLRYCYYSYLWGASPRLHPSANLCRRPNGRRGDPTPYHRFRCEKIGRQKTRKMECATPSLQSYNVLSPTVLYDAKSIRYTTKKKATFSWTATRSYVRTIRVCGCEGGGHTAARCKSKPLCENRNPSVQKSKPLCKNQNPSCVKVETPLWKSRLLCENQNLRSYCWKFMEGIILP